MRAVGFRASLPTKTRRRPSRPHCITALIDCCQSAMFASIASREHFGRARYVYKRDGHDLRADMRRELAY